MGKTSRGTGSPTRNSVFGPTEHVPDFFFQQINEKMVREAVLKTKGSGGPSGVDSNGFRRMMDCKSFKKSARNLFSAIATLTRRLCTEYVDPRNMEAILADRLIQLDKEEGNVRPTAVGETIRQTMGTCVMSVTKQVVIDACDSLQVCAGHKSGSEAGVHAMRSIFDANDIDAVLLIGASNAFNSLNRTAALHNITVLCSSIATYALNTYRRHARLFVMGGKEPLSAEKTTQGELVAISLYAVSLPPLIINCKPLALLNNAVCRRRYREWYTGKCDAMVGRTIFERTCFRVFPER